MNFVNTMLIICIRNWINTIILYIYKWSWNEQSINIFWCNQYDKDVCAGIVLMWFESGRVESSRCNHCFGTHKAKGERLILDELCDEIDGMNGHEPMRWFVDIENFSHETKFQQQIIFCWLQRISLSHQICFNKFQNCKLAHS